MPPRRFDFDLIIACPSLSGLPAAEWSREMEERIHGARIDARLGLGKPGTLTVQLTREGDDAEAVILAAAREICAALPPDARLVEAGPDLVSLAELAARLGMSRQAVRKRPLPPARAGGLFRLEELIDTAFGGLLGVVGRQMRQELVAAKQSSDRPEGLRASRNAFPGCALHPALGG